MDDIKAWLCSSKSYESGVQLYLKYGSNPTLRALFTTEEQSAFKAKKLLQVLTDLHDQWQQPASQAAIISNQSKPNAARATAYRGWPNPITDPVIQALHDQWKPMYIQLMNLQARAYEVALLAQRGDPNKKLEACQVVHKILDLDDQLESIYHQRDQYILHGQLPGAITKVVELVGDPVRWATELEKAKRYVRRYKAKLKTTAGTSKNAVHWAELLQQYESQVMDYSKKLKLIE
jgi:hypothetical protein